MCTLPGTSSLCVDKSLFVALLLIYEMARLVPPSSAKSGPDFLLDRVIRAADQSFHNQGLGGGQGLEMTEMHVVKDSFYAPSTNALAFSWVSNV